MFKTIYFKIEFLRRFIGKNLLSIIIGITLGSLFAYFRPTLVKFIISKQIQQEIIGINGLYTVNKLPLSITQLISYGLTIPQNNGKSALSPLVRKITTNDTNTEYTITLNSDITWHNGKKLTPSDVNYSFSGSTVKPVNNNALKITTENAFSPLLSLLSKPLLKKDLVGNGPYQVTKISYQDSYVKQLSLKPRLNNLIFKTFQFYSSEKSLISAYKMGKIDIIDQISDPLDLNQWPKTEINQKLDYQQYIAIFINTSKIKDKKNRQALAYATPKPINRKDRCLGPISPDSWAYNNSVKVYDENITRAKELIDKSTLDKINISLNDRRLLPLAEAIKTSWINTLGISVNISIENQIDTQNYDVILAYGSIPIDPDQYLYWHSTQKTNLTKLNNSRIDKLLEDGRSTFDNTERKKIYLDFQRYLLEESPAIFLSYPTLYTISRIK